VLVFDERLTMTLSKGGEIGQGGWVSRGYHRKASAWTARGTLRASAAVTLQTRLQFGELK
jgi:predicted RNase H-like nuclease (RuvC/YqgF family)